MDATDLKEVVNPNNKKTNMRKKTKLNARVTSGGADNIPGVVSLPEEIIFDILTMLPVRSLFRFSCVSKSWNNLFKTSTRFAKLQADYSSKNFPDGILLIGLAEKIYYLDYDSLISASDSSTLDNKLVDIAYPPEYKKKEIVGSSNGLVCYTESDGGIIIWNPLTKDHKKIQELPVSPSLRFYDYHYGFCYDSKTEDYKIVGYHCNRRNDHIYLYSLKFNSWRTITVAPLEWPFGSPIFYEGFFHWGGDYFPGPGPKPKETSCFDIANETVKQILLPKHFPKKFEKVQVCLLGGRLCLSARYARGAMFPTRIGAKGATIPGDAKYYNWEVWTMKDDGTVEDYWTKIFTNCDVESAALSMQNKMNLRLQRPEFLKQTCKNASILVYHDSTRIYLYDLNNEVFRKLEVDNTLQWDRTWPFCGSLVSPNFST